MNKTKIIATITDAYTEEKLIAIAQAGANIVRLNFSHAKQETTKPLIQLIHKLNKEGKTNLGILLDTKGPEVRTGERTEPYHYTQGEHFKIFVDKTKMSQNSDMFCDYAQLLEEIHVGDTIAIESGLMNVKVEKVHKDYLLIISEDDCEIGSRRHMNFPSISLNLPGLTEKDKSDLLFGLENGIHYIAASFVRTKENIEEIRNFLAEKSAEQGFSTPAIIAKIENQEGITNIDDIVQVSDGIMIARGDLGIEIPIHQLPYYQKYILDTCFKYGKTCIMATELLKSMTYSPFPTRAEVSDVYNSVIARVDAVMLSDETAIGKFPIETVTLMRETVEEAEKHTINKHKDFTIIGDEVSLEKKLITKHALLLADEIGAKCMIVFSHSEKFPKIIAGLKPNQMIYAFTPDQTVIDKMRILFGIQGMKLEKRANHTTENQTIAMQMLLEKGLIKKGDKIVLIGDKKRGEQKDPLIRVTTV